MLFIMVIRGGRTNLYSGEGGCINGGGCREGVGHSLKGSGA